MTLDKALSRTILLMKQDLDPQTPDGIILGALRSVKVVLRAGHDTLSTHSGQSALIAAALTMARSGHDVWIDAEEMDCIGAQPPLSQTRLVAGLLDTGRDLLPGVEIVHGQPSQADLAFLFGACKCVGRATRNVRLDATDWAAELGDEERDWSARDWPIGGLAAAAMASSEAFKIASRRLAKHARDPGFYRELHAPCDRANFCCAPPETPKIAQMPPFGIISAGAIANSVLFTLLRIPAVRGSANIFDADVSALSNLNRNALLRRSALDRAKVNDLSRLAKGLQIIPAPLRYERGMPLARHVLVGVDDIASRWDVQRADPAWCGIGATEGYSAMASSHPRGEPCSACLHPIAAPATSAPIPTASFVSFLAGLVLAVSWLRELAGGAQADERQLFVSALRPDTWSFGWMPIAASHHCPVGCQASLRKAA